LDQIHKVGKSHRAVSVQRERCAVRAHRRTDAVLPCRTRPTLYANRRPPRALALFACCCAWLERGNCEIELDASSSSSLAAARCSYWTRLQSARRSGDLPRSSRDCRNSISDIGSIAIVGRGCGAIWMLSRGGGGRRKSGGRDGISRS
jgi:hypothetical protein